MTLDELHEKHRREWEEFAAARNQNEAERDERYKLLEELFADDILVMPEAFQENNIYELAAWDRIWHPQLGTVASALRAHQNAELLAYGYLAVNEIK